jgi:hypothetical protein
VYADHEGSIVIEDAVERDTQLRDDGVVRLDEDPGEIGADASREVTRVEALSVSEDALNTRDLLSLVAPRCSAETALEGVAHQARIAAGAGDVHEEGDVSLGEVLAELPLGNSGLHVREAQLGVDVDDLVHATEIDEQVVLRHREPLAVADVLGGAVGVENEAMAVGQLHDRLHLLHRLRVDDPQAPTLEAEGVVGPPPHLLGVRTQQLGADDALELAHHLFVQHAVASPFSPGSCTPLSHGSGTPVPPRRGCRGRSRPADP